MERPTALIMIYAGDGHPWSTTTSSRPNVLQGFLSVGEIKFTGHITVVNKVVYTVVSKHENLLCQRMQKHFKK